MNILLLFPNYIHGLLCVGNQTYYDKKGIFSTEFVNPMKKFSNKTAVSNQLRDSDRLFGFLELVKTAVRKYRGETRVNRGVS
jgi:hypothetical protein